MTCVSPTYISGILKNIGNLKNKQKFILRNFELKNNSSWIHRLFNLKWQRIPQIKSCVVYKGIALWYLLASKKDKMIWRWNRKEQWNKATEVNETVKE